MCFCWLVLYYRLNVLPNCRAMVLVGWGNFFLKRLQHLRWSDLWFRLQKTFSVYVQSSQEWHTAQWPFSVLPLPPWLHDSLTAFSSDTQSHQQICKTERKDGSLFSIYGLFLNLVPLLILVLQEHHQYICLVPLPRVLPDVWKPNWWMNKNIQDICSHTY